MTASPRKCTLIAALLCSGFAAQAAQLERAQDLPFLYGGQASLGVMQNGTPASDSGLLSEVFDDGSFMRWDGNWLAEVDNGDGQASLSGYHSLSIQAGINGAGEAEAFLIDGFTSLAFSARSAGGAQAISIGNDVFSAPAYADLGLQQSFRILPSAGESLGQAVQVSVGADFFPGATAGDPRIQAEVELAGLPGQSFRILRNGSVLFEAGGPWSTAGNLYASSFVGQIGDVITFEGPAMVSRLWIDGQSFGPEPASAYADGGFFAGISVAAVPEAGTWSMMAMGLALVGVAARGRERDGRPADTA